MKNQEYNLYSFENEFEDDECNIWDEVLNEDVQSHEVLRQLSLESNMDCNSFSKFDKSYAKRNNKKYKSQGDMQIKEAKLLNQNWSQISVECFDANENLSKLQLESEFSNNIIMQSISSDNAHNINGANSLKAEVSMLLKVLANSRRNRQFSNTLNPSFNISGWPKTEEEKYIPSELITMRDVQSA